MHGPLLHLLYTRATAKVAEQPPTKSGSDQCLAHHCLSAVRHAIAGETFATGSLEGWSCATGRAALFYAAYSTHTDHKRYIILVACRTTNKYEFYEVTHSD